jgi:hypothetical protein
VTDARHGWFVAGFLAATLAAALLNAPPAAAQESPSLRGGQWPAAAAQAGGPRRTDAGYGRGDGDGSYATPDQPADEEPGEPPEMPEDDSDLPQAAPKGPPRDGDISNPVEPDSPRDGVSSEGEPQAPEDGGDPTIDSRPPEDSAVFADPPAGYDPLLFVIEDIDPIVTDRRPARLFRIEPYDPVGIRIGSFILFPEAEVAGLATNNVEGTAGGHSDVGAEVATRTRLVSNWSRHAVELRAVTFSSFYDDHPSEDDRDWTVEGRGRLDITRRTNIQGLVSRDFGQESRSAIDGVTTGERPDVTTDIAALTLNNRFNRLALQLRGSLTDVEFSSTVNGGIISTNADRNSLTSEETLRLSYELKPTFAIFAETGVNQRSYDAAPSDGILRDSDGERYRLGIDFGGTGEVLRGEASIGYGRQTPDDGRLDTVDAFLLDANLAWRATELTSLLFLARTDIYDTTTTGSAGVVSHQIGVEARHAFRTYLVATAGLTYTDNDYDSNPIEESTLTTIVGAEYFANRDIILFGRYQHDAFDSNQPASDYHEDSIRLGLRVRK